MAVKVWVRKGLLGESGIEASEIPAGLTCRDLLQQIEPRLPANITVQIGIDGKLIEEPQLDEPLRDGQQVIVCPTTTFGIDWVALLIYAVVMAAVSFAVSYAMQQLAPRPKVPGEPQERGDARSPTYSWDGIQTNYGQGFPVPAVYGRHATGGQVIYTDVYASTSGGLVDDRLNIVLALSEGPIARIGDTDAGELDGLGGISVGAPGPALPDHIRVNNVLLESTNTAQTVSTVRTNLWSAGTPTWGVGQQLSVVLRATGVAVGVLQVLQVNNSLKTDLDVLLASGTAPNPTLHNLEDRSGPAVNVAVVTFYTTQVRLNQRPGAIAYIRPGSMDQSALPANPFRGTSVTYSPGEQLDEANQEAIFAFELDQTITTVGFVLSAPAGIYAQDNQGNLQPYPVIFEIAWRPESGMTWRAFYQPGNLSQSITRITIGATVRTGPVLESFGGNPAGLFDPPVSGPIEVRIRRLSPSGGTNSVSSVIWRNVFFNNSTELRYPRVALLGLTLASGARFNGGLPSFNVRVDGIKVRVWDATHGFSPRTWEAFTTGNWAFMSRPPGRNPAWILLDFLTSPWGLGAYLNDSDLDLPSFRRWAAFCDTEPSPLEPWNEAGFQCDLVIDSPRPAWDWVLTICAAGRASPIYRDGKIGVVYQYRDAHGDSGISVAAKTVTQLLTSGNVEKVQVTWLPKNARPTAYQFQYLNEAELYAQDVLTVEDAASTMNDPSATNAEQWRPEVLQAYGVCRASQLWREGVFRHRINRLVRRELSFVTGRWALAAEVGDLISFEHDLLRPFGGDVPLNLLVTVGGTAVSQISVDHDLTGLTVPAGIVIRDGDGKPITTTITGVANQYDLTLGATVTCSAGATCVIGKISKLVETYQIVAITLQRDLKREVRALQWVPEIHDPVTPSDYAAGGGGTDFDEPEAGEADPTTEAEEILVTPLPNGSHRIAWGKLPGRRSVITRVYVRAADGDRWALVAATEEEACVYEHFAPGTAYWISLVFETADGDAPQPDAGVLRLFVAPEFPSLQPPQISNLHATAIDQGILVEWDAIDVLYAKQYEIRLGSDWNAGRVLYRGRAPRAVLIPAPVGQPTILVALQADSGLYGQPAALVLPAWIPVGTVQVLSEDDLAPSPAGTHSGTEFSGGVVRLTSASYSGSYTSAEQDLSYQAPFHCSVTWDSETLDDVLVEELDFTLDSGEARWRSVNGRQASPGRPGVDFERTVDDLTGTVEDLPEALRVAGNWGEPGNHALVTCESRFYANAAWSSWRPHEDRRVVCSKMQFRFLFNREALVHHPRVTAISYRAHI